jgi:hypothetical protein
MNIIENINRINSLMTEGKDAYVERARYDQEYEEEYPKWQKIMIRFLEMEINSYTEINDDKIIVLFHKKDLSKNLMKYDKINEQIWWDYSLQDMLMKLVPYGYVSRHFKYAIQDFFKKHFPDYGVRDITAANIVSY